MKKFFQILFISSIISFSLKSQITVGNMDFTTGGRIGGLNEKDYESFKKSTTYFVIPPFDTDKKSQYEEILKKTWTVTPIKIVTFKEAEAINNSTDKSFIKLTGVKINDGLGVTYSFYYQISMFYENKKQELIEKSIAKIEFNVKYSAYNHLVSNRYDLNALAKYMYSNNIYHNYDFGFIKNYLSSVNECLLNNKPKQYRMKEKDKAELSKVIGDTLFIPDYVCDHPDAKLENALSDAKFKYKVITAKELNNKLLTCKNTFYYLNYTRSGYYKLMNIVSSTDGKFAFSFFDSIGLSVNNQVMNAGDTRQLNKVLEP